MTKIVIDKENEITKLENMLETLTDEKDKQSVRFAINVISGFNEVLSEVLSEKPLSDLINREALKKAIKDNGYSHYFEIFDIIDNAQTVEIDLVKVAEEHEKIGFKKGFNEGYAQAQVDLERPQGEWLDVVCENGGFFHGTCSVCKIRNDIPPLGMANFCPNCGADMRGAE